jgi:hypothetical protein
MADRRVVELQEWELLHVLVCPTRLGLGNTLEDVKKSLHEAEPGITFQDTFAELGIKSNVAGVPDLSEAEMKELIAS